MTKLQSVLFVCLLVLVTACTNGDNTCEEPMLKGIISMYNEYDGAMLDFTEADMEKAGFTLGDLISLTLDDNTFIVPYYDGYYTRGGEYLLSHGMSRQQVDALIQALTVF